MVRATATPAAKKAPATKPAAAKATKTTKKTEAPAPVEAAVVETPVGAGGSGGVGHAKCSFAFTTF